MNQRVFALLILAIGWIKVLPAGCLALQTWLGPLVREEQLVWQSK